MSDLMLDCFGRAVYPFALKPDDIRIEEVAESLAKICRFNGHYNGPPYSVAEHSLNVEALLERESNNPLVQLVGLLHDAHEMLLGDISSPWYPYLQIRAWEPNVSLKRFANLLQNDMLTALIPSCALPIFRDMHPEIMQIVDDADHQILLWEKENICHSDLPWPGQDGAHSIPVGLLPVLPIASHYLFIVLFFKETYFRLFSAVEAAYGPVGAHGDAPASPDPDHANGFSGS